MAHPAYQQEFRQPVHLSLYRASQGMPRKDESNLIGMLVSLLLHVLLFLVLFRPSPPIQDSKNLAEGGGGLGPLGGGGGSEGTQRTETIRYIEVSHSFKAVRTPRKIRVALPKAVYAKAAPKISKPQPVPKPKPAEVIQAAQVAQAAPIPEVHQVPEPSTPVPAPTRSIVQEMPAELSANKGKGPGKGGGVGSGEGIGVGVNNGPGDGGVPMKIFPPKPVAFFTPPMPPPRSLKGFKFVAECDVDPSGRVLECPFTPTPDESYNRLIERNLKLMRFKPGMTEAGAPARSKAKIIYQF